MTSQSRLFIVLWWLICLTPPLNVVLAVDSTTSRSADEALGGVFVTVPLFLLTIVLAPIVLIATVRSREAVRAEKLTASVLTASLVPMYVLVSASWWWLGWEHGRPSSPAGILCLIATAAWVAGAVALRRWCRRA
jgi:hypothetical protein